MTPWGEKPYSLVSWWEMQKFCADKFCVITANMGGYSEEYQRKHSQICPPETRNYLARELQLVADRCREIGLEVAPLQIEASISSIVSPALTLSYGQIGQSLVGLGQAIASEMKVNLFLWVPREKAKRILDISKMHGAIMQCISMNIMTVMRPLVFLSTLKHSWRT